MSPVPGIAMLVEKTIHGDPDAFAELLRQPSLRIDQYRDALPGLMLTADAVRRVLTAFQHQEASPSLVQQ